MNDIEDRLRDAYQTVERAIRPETIRPHVLPAGQKRPRSTGFVPLAAAAAVIAVIAGAVTVPHLLRDSPRATPGAPSTNPERSYLADLIPPWIELRDPATGKVLSRTPPPESGAWQSLVAIDGGAKFLLETSSSDYCNGGPFKMYMLTPGKPDRLKPYMTLPGFIEEFTASADGSTLAYLTYPCEGGRPGAEILSVVKNGATRDWTLPSSLVPGSLSLSADGGELGYVNTTTDEAQRGTAAVLSTGSPPGSLVRWSRPVFVPTRHGQQAEALVLSADGQTTYLLTAPGYPSTAMTQTLSAYDTATGTRLRALHSWRGVQGYPFMVADGVHALILDMHLNSIDEVNLATGAARWFEQLRDGTGDVFGIAW